MASEDAYLNLESWLSFAITISFQLKFFYWETGYFNTLDITLDRAGYYLCWGCLCWVQASISNPGEQLLHNSRVLTL